jgi:hypothetical protein
MIDKTDKFGRPLGLMEWAELLENRAYAQIGNDMGSGLRVSTVWVGLQGDRFETMVFDELNRRPGDGLSQYERRYATLNEAEVGHAKVIEEVKNDTRSA